MAHMIKFLTKDWKPMFRVEYMVKGVLKRRDYAHKKYAIKCLAHWVVTDYLDDGHKGCCESFSYEGDIIQLLQRHDSIDSIHDYISFVPLESAVHEKAKRWQSGVDEIPF